MKGAQRLARAVRYYHEAADRERRAGRSGVEYQVKAAEAEAALEAKGVVCCKDCHRPLSRLDSIARGRGAKCAHDEAQRRNQRGGQ